MGIEVEEVDEGVVDGSAKVERGTEKFILIGLIGGERTNEWRS